MLYMLTEPAIILKDIQLEKDTQKIMVNNKHSGDLLIVSDVCVYLKEVDKKYPIAISLMANAKKGVYEGIKVNNYIITIFGHDNIDNTISEAVRNKYVMFYDRKKIQEIDQFTGKSLSNALSSLESNVIIQKIELNVK